MAEPATSQLLAEARRPQDRVEAAVEPLGDPVQALDLTEGGGQAPEARRGRGIGRWLGVERGTPVAHGWNTTFCMPCSLAWNEA